MIYTLLITDEGNFYFIPFLRKISRSVKIIASCDNLKLVGFTKPESPNIFLQTKIRTQLKKVQRMTAFIITFVFNVDFENV